MPNVTLSRGMPITLEAHELDESIRVPQKVADVFIDDLQDADTRAIEMVPAIPLCWIRVGGCGFGLLGPSCEPGHGGSITLVDSHPWFIYAQPAIEDSLYIVIAMIDNGGDFDTDEVQKLVDEYLAESPGDG